MLILICTCCINNKGGKVYPVPAECCLLRRSLLPGAFVSNNISFQSIKYISLIGIYCKLVVHVHHDVSMILATIWFLCRHKQYIWVCYTWFESNIIQLIRCIKTTLMTVYLTGNLDLQGYWFWTNGICCKFTIYPFDYILSIRPVFTTDGWCRVISVAET